MNQIVEREYTECSYVVSFSDAERAIEIAL